MEPAIVQDRPRRRGLLRPASGTPSVRKLRSLVGRRAWVCGGAAALLAGVSWLLLGTLVAVVFAASVGLVWFLVPPLGRFVRSQEVVAHPGGRAVHRRPTPLMGGLALYLPIALTLLLHAIQEGPRALGLLGAVTLMAVTGAIDDIRGLRARQKFLLQGLGAGFLLLAGYRIDALSLQPVGSFELGWFGMPLLVLWVVAVTNAFNLVDGIDGLAGIMAFVAAAGAAAAGSNPVIAAALAGACVGFLRHNLPRASIFLGDTGSLVLGMTVAGLTLGVTQTDNLAIAMGLVAYPAGDVTLAVIRRLLRGKHPFTADRSHLHHKIMAHLSSPVRTLVFLLAFASFAAALPLVLPGAWALFVLAVAWGLLVLTVVRVCNIRIDLMVRHRPHFRHLHRVRKRLLAEVHHAPNSESIRRVLARIPGELDLAGVHALGTHVSRSPLRGGTVQRVQLRLSSGTAHWEYVPWADDRTLDTELHGVVCEVLRVADRRIAVVRLRGPAG